MKKTMLAIAAASALVISGMAYAEAPAPAVKPAKLLLDYNVTVHNWYGKNVRLFAATENAKSAVYEGHKTAVNQSQTYQFQMPISENNRIFIYNAAELSFGGNSSHYCYCELPAYQNMNVAISGNECTYVAHDNKKTHTGDVQFNCGKYAA